MLNESRTLAGRACHSCWCPGGSVNLDAHCWNVLVRWNRKSRGRIQPAAAGIPAADNKPEADSSKPVGADNRSAVEQLRWLRPVSSPNLHASPSPSPSRSANSPSPRASPNLHASPSRTSPRRVPGYWRWAEEPRLRRRPLIEEKVSDRSCFALPSSGAELCRTCEKNNTAQFRSAALPFLWSRRNHRKGSCHVHRDEHLSLAD